MIVWDDECRARVKKHRQMREKKGFETAERPVDLGELFVPEDGAVLVECMSNLAANEMYREDVGMESCAELRGGPGRRADLKRAPPACRGGPGPGGGDQ